MSAWRRRALALFPDLRQELERRDSTPNTLFLELLPRAYFPHQSSLDAELTRIYGYAYWCIRQNSGDLRNAAAVSFFEHIFDEWHLRHAVIPWVAPEAFVDFLPLWKLRLSEERVSELHRLMRTRTSVSYHSAIANSTLDSMQ